MDKCQKYPVSLVFALYSICLLIFKSLRSNKYHFWSNSSKSVVSFFKKDYLWQKIEVGTLYFSANSRFKTPPIIACKHQNIVNLSSHVTLYVVSALSCKNSVVSSGTGGDKSMIVKGNFGMHNL